MFESVYFYWSYSNAEMRPLQYCQVDQSRLSPALVVAFLGNWTWGYFTVYNMSYDVNMFNMLYSPSLSPNSVPITNQKQKPNETIAAVQSTSPVSLCILQYLPAKSLVLPKHVRSRALLFCNIDLVRPRYLCQKKEKCVSPYFRLTEMDWDILSTQKDSGGQLRNFCGYF